MQTSLYQRIAPFLALLDARYLPLLFVAAPQAYTVYDWLRAGGTPDGVALLGGLGFEFVYVGAIAWADRGAGWSAARTPAITALLFSSGVAVAHYATTQGVIAVLHIGFPLVGFAYTVMMHTPAPSERPAQLRAALDKAATRAAQAETTAAQLRNELEQAWSAAETARNEAATAAAASGTEAAQARSEAQRAQQAAARAEAEAQRLRDELAQVAIQIGTGRYTLRDVGAAFETSPSSVLRRLSKIETASAAD